MTCIVAIKRNGTVWMGGDRAGSAEHRITSYTGAKVFAKGELLIGYTGSFRFGQLLQYVFVQPKQISKEGTTAYMVKRFIPAVSSVLVKEGYNKYLDDDFEHFLVGYRGHLYEVQSDKSVLEPILPYTAIGSGMDIANGALAILSATRQPAKAILHQALVAATDAVATVAPPFDIMGVTR